MSVCLTTSALHSLLVEGIELALFSFRGELLGQLTPPLGKNIPLHIAQFSRHSDAGFSLDISRKIVSAKIANARAVLQRYRDNHPGSFSAHDMDTLENLSTAAGQARDLSSLLGLEGAAAAHYFGCLGRMLRAPWQFTARSRRPPQDPVNAVLSFGYVVVGAQIQALLDGSGLDPYLGFYHQPDYGRPGLALDLLEEFRHPLVDRLAVRLFNQGILQETHFFRPANGGVFLNTEGKRRFFRHYEKMLGEWAPTAQFTSPGGFRSILQQQIERLIRTIQNGAVYQPFQLTV